MIVVQAENLVDGCWCVFEHTSAALAPVINQNSTLGRRLGEYLLGCPVPDLGGPGVGWANLRIALDSGLRTKSQSALLLRITDRCPPGYSCTDGEIRECPPGHECPGVTLE